jgi:hypothetical protein
MYRKMCGFQVVVVMNGYEWLCVVMKNLIFGDITPCSPLKFYRRFGGTSEDGGEMRLRNLY